MSGPTRPPIVTATVSATETWGQTPSPGAAVDLPARAEGHPLPALERGGLVVFRQFDVANEINLAVVERLSSSQRMRLAPRGGATALVLSNPPLSVQLGTKTVELAGRRLEAELVARVFDFGVISVRLRLALPSGTAWEELSAHVAAAQTSEAITKLAQDEVKTLCNKLAAALEGRHDNSDIYEDYVVAFVERFADGAAATSLPLDAIARLLLGERADAKLSPSEIEEATRQRSSYYDGDLCVSGWSTALVVEPDGDSDPVDVLELANAQLLELRYYDALLDRELGLLYDETASRKRRLSLLRSYGPVLRRAMAVMLEIAEFIERAENALKIIGDVYLARLYANAVESLRIPSWERSVTRKEGLVKQVYDVLKSEVDAGRDQLLELTIILLIVFEIVFALQAK